MVVAKFCTDPSTMSTSREIRRLNCRKSVSNLRAPENEGFFRADSEMRSTHRKARRIEISYSKNIFEFCLAQFHCWVAEIRVDQRCFWLNYFDGVDDPFITHRVYLHDAWCGYSRLLKGEVSKKFTSCLWFECRWLNPVTIVSTAQSMKFHDGEETFTPICFGPF